MAKAGFWLRNAKGKLAGATIYKQNGETVMREIVSPSNPKTVAQMIQRIIMTTVMQAYSWMKALCDHSFEGVKKGQPTMSVFMTQNLDLLRNKVAQAQANGQDLYDVYSFLKLGQKGFVPNGYQIARGSLPQVVVTFDEDEYTKGFVAALKTNTYQGVIDALGLQRGDQLTFLALHQGGVLDDPASVEFSYARVILDPTTAEGLPAPLSTTFIVNGAPNLPSVRNEGSFSSFAISAETGLSFAFKVSSMIAAAVIVSRKTSSDKWLRSNTYLSVKDGDDGLGISLGQALDNAMSGSSIYTPNSTYLNNAGTGGEASSGENAGGGGGGETPPPGNPGTDGD